MHTFLFVGLRCKRGYGQGRARPDQERRGRSWGLQGKEAWCLCRCGLASYVFDTGLVRRLGDLNVRRHTGSGKVDWVGAYGPVYAPSVSLVAGLVAGNQRYRREHWQICHRKKLSWTEGAWDTGLFWYLHISPVVVLALASRRCGRIGDRYTLETDNFDPNLTIVEHDCQYFHMCCRPS